MSARQPESSTREEQLSLSLEAAKRRASELQQFAAATIDAVSGHLCVLDPEGRFLSVNKAWVDFWDQNQPPGCQSPFPMGSNYLDVCDQAQGPDAEGASEMAQAIRSVTTGEKERVVVEYPCHSPDQRRWFMAIVTRFQGEVANVVVVHESITERTLAEERRDLLETRLRLSEKLEALGTLTSGIAHDFNNIMSAVIGYTQLAREDAEGNEDVLESLDEVKQASARAVALVKQMMTASEDDRRSQRPIQLGPVVEATMSMLRAEIPANVEFQITLEAKICQVCADAGQIHQVIVNLVRNAAQAIGPHPGQIEVRLANLKVEEQNGRDQGMNPGDYVLLSVSDSGHGLDAATLARIFDPFFTTKEQGPGQGQGLGLSVVYRVTKNHRGAIRAHSEIGRGTILTILLPALPAEPAMSPSLAPQTTSTTGLERILLVDDEVAVGKVTAAMLRRRGYLVDLETVPENALALLLSRAHEYTLLITDLTMPGLSGLELADRVHREWPELPILLASGQSAHLCSAVLTSAGIGGVLDKPFSAEALAQSVRRSLDA